jgi:hypothetical protein
MTFRLKLSQHKTKIGAIGREKRMIQTAQSASEFKEVAKKPGRKPKESTSNICA